LAAEHKLTGVEITALLTDATVSGGSGDAAFKQYFAAGGATTYVGSENTPSQGSWRVQGDQYCSVWPPSGTWVCYDVEGDPTATPPTVTWIGDSGTRYPGTVAKGNKL
jgi:hypothetical protein